MARRSRGVRLEIDHTSLKRVLRNVERRGIEMKREAAKFLRREGRSILAEVKSEIPEETGALRASARLRVSARKRGGVSVTISVGGQDAPYAVIVHEDTQARHGKGKAKFVEDPVRRHVSGLARGLAVAMGA